MVYSPKRARLTIGVILDQVAGESRSSLWPGIADTIAAHDGNILCFAGGYLRPSDDPAAGSNIVYEMVDAGALGGLIIWTSALSSYVAHDNLLRFCDRFRPLPTVSIGLALTGIPGVVLDSYQGMREALIHLITVHARRRLVFIRGPEGHRDADERYRAYRDVLKEYDLPYVPELVSPPYKWYDPGGVAMMHTLLDEQHLAFDAVASSHDAAAVQAIEALQARGIRVPEDVSITGFDDTPLSRLVTPPLTTVPWRMYERGCQAATLLMSMLAGETVPNEVRLPAHLVVRQSCGCLDPAVMQARTFAPVVDVPAATPSGEAPRRVFGADQRDLCMAALEQVIEDRGDASEWLATFLDTFFDDLTGETSGAFLPALDKILRQVALAGGDIASWQAAVSALRRRLLPALMGDDKVLVRAEDLWHQARVMIGEHARRLRGYREWMAHQQTERLRRISRVLATKTTIPDLMNVLAEELPHLGIPSCYLALYEDPSQPAEWCRLILAYDENGRIPLPPEGRRVRAKHLAAGGEMPTANPYHILVAPLYFQSDQLGLILFAQQPVGDIYEVLRDEISTTLKGILLAEQNVILYQQALAAEKAAQEGRLLAEEADRLKSSFLSMVSHELLTPLVLLVGLSEMMLREGTGNRPPLPTPYRADLARIHLTAAHLGNLVRDVLDLTRSQMGLLKLSKKPFDFDEMIKAVALVGEEMARGKGLAWQADVAACLPMVYGDSSRLQQVVLNLVANAVKFTRGVTCDSRLARRGGM